LIQAQNNYTDDFRHEGITYLIAEHAAGLANVDECHVKKSQNLAFNTGDTLPPRIQIFRIDRIHFSAETMTRTVSGARRVY
jgi:hypothetical protein